MFNNPYYQSLPQNNISKIDNQIKELESLKMQYQNIPQQIPPINQTFQLASNTPITQFEAKFIGKDEVVEDILINHRTAFISPENHFLKVKELDGTITTYELIPPLDEKDKKIKELEEKINELSNNNKSINDGKKSDEYDNVNIKSTTKTKSK